MTMRMDWPRGFLATGTAVLTQYVASTAFLVGSALATPKPKDHEFQFFDPWGIVFILLIPTTGFALLVGVPFLLSGCHSFGRQGRSRRDYATAVVAGLCGAAVPVFFGVVAALITGQGLVVLLAVIAGYIAVPLVTGAHHPRAP